MVKRLEVVLLSRDLFAAFDSIDDRDNEPADQGDDDALLIGRRSRVVFHCVLVVL